MHSYEYSDEMMNGRMTPRVLNQLPTALSQGNSVNAAREEKWHYKSYLAKA